MNPSTNPCWSTLRGWLFAGLVLPATAAIAQISPPPGTGGTVELVRPPPTVPTDRPLAPAIDSPAAGLSRGGHLGTGPTLVWNQGGQVPLNVSKKQPPLAQHFVVCLAPAPAPACTWPGQFNAAVATIPRQPWTQPQLGATSPGRYSYTYAVPAPWANFVDRDLVLTVGACASQTQAACSFSSPRSIRWTAQNIAVSDMGAGQSFSDGTNWAFTVSVTANNEGSAVAPLAARAVIREALQDARYECLRDVNAAGLLATDVVIGRDGSERPVSSLPLDTAGRRIGTDVVAIWRQGAFALTANGTTVPLAQGAMDRPVVEFTATGAWPASPGSPKRFVATVELDSGSTLIEWNETDNRRAKCPGRAIFR